MEQRSARTLIRPWRRHDDDQADEWPSYDDPLDSLWNLPRQLTTGSSHWANGFESGGTRRTWAVEDLSGQLIGRISLREIDERSGVARLGITFGAPYVGRGLGTEALAAFLDSYFTDLSFRAMVLDVAAPNQRAVRCYHAARLSELSATTGVTPGSISTSASSTGHAMWACASSFALGSAASGCSSSRCAWIGMCGSHCARICGRHSTDSIGIVHLVGHGIGAKGDSTPGLFGTLRQFRPMVS